MAMKPFSKERLNFFRFSTLVLDEFPKVLRKIFISMWDSNVALKPGNIPWDDSATVRNLLLKYEGGKTDIPTGKSIEDWDCTALFKATIFAETFGTPGKKNSTLYHLYLKKSKPAPGSFHLSVQSPTGNRDETYALVIDQLRLLRNTFCHSADAEIIKADFDAYVKLVQNALNAVHLDTSFVDDIGHMNEDDFPTEKVQKFQDCRIKELQINSMFHESILSSIEEHTEKINSVEKKIMEKVENLGIKAAPDILPKPHLPRRDPKFTGREKEIKEMTNLITDESTRLLNIWGSPGFGKTSTTAEVAHHLNESLGYRVYFFKLHCTKTVDNLLSKILGIFRSSGVDPTITHLDKVVSIFREISSPVILVFDNFDDLLTGGAKSTELRDLLDEFLESNDNIKIVFTTRALLQTTRGQVEGFRELRIRSMSLNSSVKFVRQLLPSFSESVVQRVVRISFHVPLAMKILASSLAQNSEDIAIKMLDEFNFSENIVEQIDDHAYDEEKLEKILESVFERLALNEKQALIILVTFASQMVSKNAAVDIISGEMGNTTKAARSLNILVEKAMIDEDVINYNEYYSVHPLIYSFGMNMAKQRDFEDVLSSSRTRFCEYYLHRFERLNDDFLAGKSINCPQLEDTMQHLSMAMLQSLNSNGLEYSKMLLTVSRILSKSEIFFFLISMPRVATNEVSKIYDLAIEKSKTLPDKSIYLKLHVSKYFQSISFSIFVECVHTERYTEDIPKSVRENISQVSDGTAAKLSCYEAIFDICRGFVKRGTEQIEVCLSRLQNGPDHLFLKCMCLQILMAYHSTLKQAEKSSEFRKRALDICAEIGNSNLLFTDDCDHETGNMSESLIVFNYLFSEWSKNFLPAEIKRYLCNTVCKLQQQNEAEMCYSPGYLERVIVYGDYLVACLSEKAESKVILNEKIECLSKSVINSIDISSEEFMNISQRNAKMQTACSAERLLFSHYLNIACTNDKDQNIEACRKALDSSLQHFGQRHLQTVKCHHNIGMAEYNLENYDSALNAFDQAFQIMLDISPEPNVHLLSDIYHRKGETCERLGEFERAFSCYEEALKLQKTNTDNEESEEIAAILFSIGDLQYGRRDFSAALATFEHVLRIRVNLFSQKRCLYRDLVSTYLSVGSSYLSLGNDTEGNKCFENALAIFKTSVDGKYESEDIMIEKCLVYIHVLHWKVEKNLNTELLNRCIPLVEKHVEWFLPIVYLTVGFNQLESGKIEAGQKFIQSALDLDLDVIQQAHALIRGMTVTSHGKVVFALNRIGKYKLAKTIIDRAFQIVETLPTATPEKPRMIRDCCFQRGCVNMNEKHYGLAIKSFQEALLHTSAVSSDIIGGSSEFQIRWSIATVHERQGSHSDALHELFLIMKNCLVRGSENEADVYFFTARIWKKMKKSSLAVRNLWLADNAYSKILGKDHPKTQQCHTKLLEECVHS